MQFNKLEYLNAEMEEKPEILTIMGTGQASYESHTNVATPNQPEIGVYEMRLSNNEMETFKRMLDSPPLKDVPDHWGRVSPSDRYKRIRVATGAETIEKLAGTKEPVDPSLNALFVRLDQFVAQVRAHPRQTLRSAFAQVNVSPNGDLTGILSLSNSGTQPVFCRNPTSLLGVPDGKLAIELWPDKAPGLLRADDSVTVDVNRVIAIQLPAGAQSGPEVVEIPPGGSASFRIYANVQVPNAGVYLARTRYTTTAEEANGRQLIVGELFSTAVKVNISKS